MLCFTKKRLPARSVVDDYTENADWEEQSAENAKPRISRNLPRIKSFGAPVVIGIIALLLIGVMLSKLVILSSEVTKIKTRLAASESLRSRVEKLEKDLDALSGGMAEKQTRVGRRESRETTVKKGAPSSPRKRTAKSRT
ncbi:MAG TPA: hypothetical protein DCR97_13310 [Deltaproteobacteria bacterium]|nr:hypothetical protein [Deltaproteobacteria bacterium]